MKKSLLFFNKNEKKTKINLHKIELYFFLQILKILSVWKM